DPFNLDLDTKLEAMPKKKKQRLSGFIKKENKRLETIEESPVLIEKVNTIDDFNRPSSSLQSSSEHSPISLDSTSSFLPSTSSTSFSSLIINDYPTITTTDHPNSITLFDITSFDNFDTLVEIKKSYPPNNHDEAIKSDSLSNNEDDTSVDQDDNGDFKRRRTQVNYAEPNLRKKLRRGDPQTNSFGLTNSDLEKMSKKNSQFFITRKIYVIIYYIWGKKLKKFLEEEKKKGHKIFPPEPDIYNWSRMTPPSSVKVVIIGQAHGLCFSVPHKVTPPPSLLNIYKALKYDIESFKIPNHGNLSNWAKEGVLLLNTSLTVRAHEAASHSNKGWEKFTDAIIQYLNNKKSGLVFMLWGNHAIKRGKNINKGKHCVLQAVHPSPLSASRGFFDCKHWSKANEYLKANGKDEINWNCLDKTDDDDNNEKK
ncbi:13432_t:CDS:10, partial [Entrophospora sp. SA101]